MGSTCPPDLSEDDLVRATEDWYLACESRLELCGRCPPEGGACASDVGSTVKVGRQPTWVGPKLDTPVCKRWREYLVRERLESSGVPKFFIDSRFSEFRREVPPDEFRKLGEFVARSANNTSGFLFLLGGPGAGKTRLGVSILRAIVNRAPRALLWYVDMTTVAGLMRQRYDEDESFGDLFGHARDAHVTVVDNVDLRSPEWLHERLEPLLRDRWLRGAATVVATRAKVTDIAARYSSIPDFKTAPSCNLQ